MTVEEAKALCVKLAADPVLDEAVRAEVVMALFAMPIDDRRSFIKTVEFKTFAQQHGRKLWESLLSARPPNLDGIDLIPAQARDAGHVFQRLKHLIAKLRSEGCDYKVSDQVVIDKLHALEAQSGGLVHASVALAELAEVRPFAVGFFMAQLTKAGS